MYLSHKLHRSQRALNWLRGVSHLSKLGIVTPEPTSSGGGLIGLAVAEAGIWGLSNIMGQQIRKGFGIQDKTHLSETLAASVFGVGVVATGANKIFKLEEGLGSMKLWKGKELVVNGAKTFASGATLGLGESILRQEMEALMNEDYNLSLIHI